MAVPLSGHAASVLCSLGPSSACLAGGIRAGLATTPPLSQAKTLAGAGGGGRSLQNMTSVVTPRFSPTTAPPLQILALKVIRVRASCSLSLIHSFHHHPLRRPLSQKLQKAKLWERVPALRSLTTAVTETQECPQELRCSRKASGGRWHLSSASATGHAPRGRREGPRWGREGGEPCASEQQRMLSLEGARFPPEVRG